jgi:hypothetical protein
MPEEQTFTVVVTDKVPVCEAFPEGFRDHWTVYFTREEAQKAYRKAKENGCYAASVCLVLESTDYFC